MFFEFVLIQKFAEQFVVAIMECNAMIVSQTRRVDLLMEFGVMLRLVKLKAKSFHCTHLPEQFIEKQRAAYIPTAEAGGLTPRMIKAEVAVAFALESRSTRLLLEKFLVSVDAIFYRLFRHVV